MIGFMFPNFVLGTTRLLNVRTPQITMIKFSILVNFFTHWVAYTHIFHLIGYSNSHCFKNVKRISNWVKWNFLLGSIAVRINGTVGQHILSKLTLVLTLLHEISC